MATANTFQPLTQDTPRIWDSVVSDRKISKAIVLRVLWMAGTLLLAAMCCLSVFFAG